MYKKNKYKAIKILIFSHFLLLSDELDDIWGWGFSFNVIITGFFYLGCLTKQNHSVNTMIMAATNPPTAPATAPYTAWWCPPSEFQYSSNYFQVALLILFFIIFFNHKVNRKIIVWFNSQSIQIIYDLMEKWQIQGISPFTWIHDFFSLGLQAGDCLSGKAWKF